jgi:hypothetical protein
MIRVMTSVGGSEKDATDAAIDLSARVSERLSDYVPD